jgi:hypothetical protein
LPRAAQQSSPQKRGSCDRRLPLYLPLIDDTPAVIRSAACDRPRVRCRSGTPHSKAANFERILRCLATTRLRKSIRADALSHRLQGTPRLLPTGKARTQSVILALPPACTGQRPFENYAPRIAGRGLHAGEVCAILRILSGGFAVLCNRAPC